MKSYLVYSVAVFGLLVTTGLATAATTSDHLNLTNAQQKEIWQGVSKQSTKQTAPSGFNAAVGATIPSSVTLHAFPSDVTRQVPAVKSNDYAMMQSQLLVVDRTSKKIVDIIRQ